MTTDGSNRWDARLYDDRHAFVWRSAASLVELLAPQRDERILDLGCGTGHLTAQLAAAGAEAVGIDASAAMIEEARHSHPGVQFVVADARDFRTDKPFDAVFSNAVFHWISDLTPVFRGVHRALRPHGRFVGEFGGHGCVAAVCTALRAVGSRHGITVELPWNFATAEDIEGCLSATGFEPLSVRLVPRPTPLPSGMAAWIQTFAGWAFDALPESDRESAYSETVELLRPALCDSRGRWTADYIRLRFSAKRVETD